MSSLGSIRKSIGKEKHRRSLTRSTFGITPMQQKVKNAHNDMGIVATTPPHPNKYPQHEVPAKGSVWRGLCNRTACDRYPATHYNLGTYGYYCGECAHRINQGNRHGPLCEAVDHSLSLAEMDARFSCYNWDGR